VCVTERERKRKRKRERKRKRKRETEILGETERERGSLRAREKIEKVFIKEVSFEQKSRFELQKF